VILPDVNVLVHAFRREYPEHEAYRSWLHAVLTGVEDLALLDPVLIGVVRISTHPRIFEQPAPLRDALAYVDVLRRAPVARSVASSDAVWSRMVELATTHRSVRGNLVPDAFIAAVATSTGARVATADAGFARFPGLSWFDPLGGS